MAARAEPRPRHTLLTPEGLPLSFEVATVVERCLAFGLDLLVLGVLAVLVVLAAAFLVVGGARTVGIAGALLASFFLRNLYFLWSEARRGGTTLGKRQVGLRVISRYGGPLSTEAVVVRNLMREVELFLPLAVCLMPRQLFPNAPTWSLALGVAWLLVFLLMPLFNRDRLRCGDLVAGTLVVRAPRPVLLADPAQAAAGDLFTPAQLDIYGIRELQVLEDVLRRFETLPADQQLTLAEPIAERIRHKIGWPSERANEPALPFLRAFYTAQRGRLEQRLLFGERREHKREPPTKE